MNNFTAESDQFSSSFSRYPCSCNIQIYGSSYKRKWAKFVVCEWETVVTIIWALLAIIILMISKLLFKTLLKELKSLHFSLNLHWKSKDWKFKNKKHTFIASHWHTVRTVRSQVRKQELENLNKPNLLVQTLIISVLFTFLVQAAYGITQY